MHDKSRTFIWLSVAISLMHIWFNTFSVLPALWQNSLHFAGFAFAAAIVYPSKWKVADLVLGTLAASSAIYIIAMEDAIYARGLELLPLEWAAAIAVILCAIELTRRVAGWVIPVLIVTALSYIGIWGQHLDNIFRFAGLHLDTILFRSIFGDDALFGTIASISSTYIFMFILFGAFLLRSGAGDFIINIARSIAGRFVGGPGLVAVIASGIMGTISGSAVANTASTGVITIPLMKRAGFPAKFAGGVEAAASTGGQLMPPIMGAGAFVMSAYTQIPYTTIVMVSILPAILYFATVGFFVRAEAKRHPQVETDEHVPVSLREGLVVLLPIAVLAGLLMFGFTPTYAAGFSIIAVVVTSRMNLKAIIEAMADGTRNMITTAIVLCSVGLIVNVISTAGIGNIFSLMISSWAGGSVFVAIVLIALASLVLGMGLPVTASYIVLATLSAPALTMLLGSSVPHALLSAHLIIFWLSQDSNVTPPVSLAAFTAAAIAGTKPLETGLQSWKIAKGLYIIPLLFAYTPFIGGTLLSTFVVFFVALVGLYIAVRLIYANS